MAWLLDTNVLSELRRPRPDSRVLAFVSAQPLDQLFVSSVTLAELRFGIDSLGVGNRRDELNDWLTNKIRPMFFGRILQVTEDIVLRWRVVVEAGRKEGHTFSQPDLIIAVTAMHHGLTMVTRDRSDFERAGATVVNPWDAT
jgi:predicted nucleic acid-binding protein